MLEIILNNRIEGFVDLIFDIIDKFEERMLRNTSKGFAIIEHLLYLFSDDNQKNIIKEYILRNKIYVESLEEAADGRFKSDSRAEEAATTIIQSYFEHESPAPYNR